VTKRAYAGIFQYSPKHTSADFHPPYATPWNFDRKVEVFEAAVLGWSLDVAELLVSDQSPVLNADFAALSIAMSYPEMIVQYIRGKSSKKKSQKFFIAGLKEVFDHVPKDLKKSGAEVYHVLRCGLYHSGRPESRVLLVRDSRTAISISMKPIKGVDVEYQVNARLVIKAFKDHFKKYIQRLKAKGEKSDLGQNFLKIFDCVCGVSPAGVFGAWSEP
jgi:hypothetical protein